ncbi:hypothetical protein LshimejAT787_1301510 [Lyophyllum shimeji]|uniref:Uncharacterized protein n=1 Tax=Lyophyllum shimeji TaxID=47721 RepID=A0A9P3PWE8_LYOSH|nr:hypothetical protein LshimejAT787_1301510 [Lyophyllum shimeji]
MSNLNQNDQFPSTILDEAPTAIRRPYERHPVRWGGEWRYGGSDQQRPIRLHARQLVKLSSWFRERFVKEEAEAGDTHVSVISFGTGVSIFDFEVLWVMRSPSFIPSRNFVYLPPS